MNPRLCFFAIVICLFPRGGLRAETGADAVTPASVAMPELVVPMSIRHLRIADPKVRAIIRVGADGQVVDSIFTQADHEELIRVAERGLEKAEFTPATQDGLPVMGDLSLEVHFLRPDKALGGTIGMPSHDHIAETIAGIGVPEAALETSRPNELDTPIAIIGRGETMVPVGENNVALKGGAVVEFWLDTEGRAHLPRIIKSDDPAISKAALFMLGETRFVPPRRHGRPTVVRLRMPFNFGSSGS